MLAIGDGGLAVVEANFPVTETLVGAPSLSGLKLAWTVSVSARPGDRRDDQARANRGSP